MSESSFSNENKKGDVIYDAKGNVFSEGIHLKKWWEPARDDKEPSLTLYFKSLKKVKTILLSENMRSHCVREFTIETKNEKGQWSTAFQGETIGEGLRIKLNGTPIYGMRLNPTKKTKNIQITAFNAYE